jgi:hypothetical protein
MHRAGQKQLACFSRPDSTEMRLFINKVNKSFMTGMTLIKLRNSGKIYCHGLMQIIVKCNF